MSQFDATEALLAERQKHYGDPAENWANVAQVWSGIIGHEITAHQAALMMVGLKLVRANTSPDHLDNLDDAAGYVRIGQIIQRTWATTPEIDAVCAYPFCTDQHPGHLLSECQG